MAGADNKAIVLRLIDEVLAKGNFAVTNELLDANFALHLPGAQEPLRGPDAIKRATENFRSAFTDRRIVVEEAISESDRVAVRVVQQGKHSGVFQGISPTGQRVSFTAIAIFRIADGAWYGVRMGRGESMMH